MCGCLSSKLLFGTKYIIASCCHSVLTQRRQKCRLFSLNVIKDHFESFPACGKSGVSEKAFSRKVVPEILIHLQGHLLNCSHQALENRALPPDLPLSLVSYCITSIEISNFPLHCKSMSPIHRFHVLVTNYKSYGYD